MAFKPLNPNNAILEAVVLLHFARPVVAAEAAAVRALHPRLKADLERLEGPPPGSSFVVLQQGPAGPGIPSALPPLPLSMSSYKRDGTVESRLLLNGAVLAVNFLVYSRWSELGRKAVGWLKECVDAMAAVQESGVPPLTVSIVSHQMIDVFKWEGATEHVGVQEMMTRKHDRLPEAAWSSKGQSWFVAHSQNGPGSLEVGFDMNVLDFLTFDLSDENSVGWRLRMEQTFEARLNPPQGGASLFDGSSATAILDDLHGRNQTLIRDLLKPELLASIGIPN